MPYKDPEKNKACMKKYRETHKEELREYNKKWYQANLEYAREYRLTFKYGITTDEYNEKHKNQNGQCAICEDRVKLVVDHCHKTEEIRGLLCNPCNQAIGLFKDRVELLSKAIDYLKKRE